MLDHIVSYSGDTVRYASLVHFDWFEVAGEAFFAERYRDYEVVTDAFLERLASRIETQKSRSEKYSEAMLERLGMAEKLLKELMDDAQKADGGSQSSSDDTQSELPEGLEGQDGAEEAVP